ncbi:MAG: KH domain-containing protein [Acidobacteria bacterium]|nr:KH domain-containing protein [Acidobacteriota bacterium]MCA1637815.1 KH domain-containing protein [Acidobacteriota bacterium]
MKEAIEKIINALVDDKDAVEVSEETGDRASVIKVRVAGSDMGKLIGREGRTIKAIRSLLFYAGQKHGKRFALDVVEDSKTSL